MVVSFIKQLPVQDWGPAGTSQTVGYYISMEDLGLSINTFLEGQRKMLEQGLTV